MPFQIRPSIPSPQTDDELVDRLLQRLFFVSLIVLAWLFIVATILRLIFD